MNRKIRKISLGFLEVYAIAFVPSLLIVVYLCSRFELTGLLFLLVTTLGTLWLSAFVACFLHIYKQGNIVWKDVNDFYFYNDLYFDWLLFIPFASLYLGTQFISKKSLSGSKGNIFLSFALAFIIPSLSLAPFGILVSLILFYYS